MAQATDAIPPPALLVTSPAPRVRVLAFNRPEKRNALSQALIDEFLRHLRAASDDPEVRAIVVTGTVSVFSAGADIKEIAALDSREASDRRYLEDLCQGLRATKKPLIAAVEGYAYGGGFEVALMCDLILASSAATFGLPEVKIGLLPGAGGTQRLTNVVGKFRAMKMILFGNKITATEAASWGLVADVFEPGTVLQNAVETASTLAALSSSAVELAKQAVLAADDLGLANEVERDLYYSAFSSADKIEGISAFLEKRSPNWS
ncbi:ClpP/crotonase [Thozetella sp. PMI_491]|nr:ClpP/crotonase [Thozetella sp. PMI_491]